MLFNPYFPLLNERELMPWGSETCSWSLSKLLKQEVKSKPVWLWKLSFHPLSYVGRRLHFVKPTNMEPEEGPWKPHLQMPSVVWRQKVEGFSCPSIVSPQALLPVRNPDQTREGTFGFSISSFILGRQVVKQRSDLEVGPGIRRWALGRWSWLWSKSHGSSLQGQSKGCILNGP